jgi:acyl-CoA thioester hydrolase
VRLSVPIALRWSDLDAYGHVNNARMLSLLEEARIIAFWNTGDGQTDPVGATTAVIDARPESDTLSLIGRQEIEYVAAIPYLRAPLDVQLWLGNLGGASLEVCYEVYSPKGVEPSILYTRAATTIVLVDAATGRPRRIRSHEREVWTPYLDDPISFRRRD